MWAGRGCANGIVEVSGAFLNDGQVKEQAAYAQGKETAERLWKLSERIVGQEFPLEDMKE
jgi:hypothetical protein